MADKSETESPRGSSALPRGLIPPGRSDTNTAAVLRLARQALAGGRLLGGTGALRTLAEESDWSPEELSATLAVALGAPADGPALLDSIRRLGRPTCIERVDAAIDLLGDPENPILGPAGS